MKPIVEKVLKSGLVDRAMAELMEKFKMIPDGSSELVQEDALKNATREQLIKLADDLATEVEKEHKVRETHLDLERIRWPAIISISKDDNTVVNGEKSYTMVVDNVSAVVDRMGRYYFRLDEIQPEWLIPGNLLVRKQGDRKFVDLILEAQMLYIDESPVCWQVAVK